MCVCVGDMNFLKNEHGCERISQDDYPENRVGRRSNRSFRMRTMTVSGSSPTHSPCRVVPYFTDTFGSVFSRTTSFVLKMIFFSYIA